MIVGAAQVQDEPCDERRCDAIEGNLCERVISKGSKCTHASFMRIKNVPELDSSGSRVVTSNSKVTVFSTSRALATPVSRMQMVYFGRHAHKKYRVPKTCQLSLT